jgi:hypothetical protein
MAAIIYQVCIWIADVICYGEFGVKMADEVCLPSCRTERQLIYNVTLHLQANFAPDSI